VPEEVDEDDYYFVAKNRAVHKKSALGELVRKYRKTPEPVESHELRAMTVRFDVATASKIDVIASNLNLSRNELVNKFVSIGMWEFLNCLENDEIGDILQEAEELMPDVSAELEEQMRLFDE
jgi:hypothetical protein